MMFFSIEDALIAISETVKEGLGPLGNGFQFTLTDVVDVSIQLAATIILFVVVRFFFWKPITNILETRRQAIDKSLEDAEIAKKNAIEIEAQLKNELNDAKLRIKEMLDKAEKDANIKREVIINDAKEEARKRLDNLELELEQEKKSMEKQIRQEMVDVAFAAAEKIVAKEINHDKYLDIVDEILKGANE
ncbi:MAG: F0F1 ATP synthase subunit B [Anaeroplasma sp.]